MMIPPFSLRQSLSTGLLALLLSACGGPDDADKHNAAAASVPQANVTVPEPAAAVSAPAEAVVPTPAEVADVSTIKPAAQTVTSLDPALVALYRNVPMQVNLISEVNYQGANTVGIRLSTPIDASQPFQASIRVNGNANKQWLIADDGLYLYLASATPETTYKIDVDPGLTGVNGSRLATHSSQTVNISPAPPSLGFASNGHYLLPDLHTGLPVQVQNVAEANVSFYRVKATSAAMYELLNWQDNRTRMYPDNLQNLTRFASLVHEGRYTLNPDKNRRQQVNLPLDNVNELGKPGIYVAVMWVPGEMGSPVSVSWYSVSDLGLHVRTRQNGMLDLYVNSLKTGNPVADATAEVYGWDGNRKRVISNGGTDRDGKLGMKYTPSSTLIVRHNNHISLLPLSRAAIDLSDFDPASRPGHEAELFMYGPRDIYRGGEKVQINALLRDVDGETGVTPVLKAELYQPDGQPLKSFSWRSEGQGFYTFEYPLTSDAQTGDWTLDVALPDKRHERYTFKVEDFMPERLRIRWNPDVQTAVFFKPEDSIKVDMLGEYLYGAPANGNRFDASIEVQPQVHPFSQWPDYFFGDPNRNDWNNRFEQNGLQTGQDGHLPLTINSQWRNTTIPLAIRITGSLFESGGRAIIRRHTETVLPKTELIGVRPLFKERANNNSAAAFELIRTNASGQLLAASAVKVRLINRNRDYHWRYDDSRGWYYEYRDQEITEMTLAVDIATDQPTQVSVPVRWGKYSLEITDPATGLVSRYDFFAGYNWYWDYADSGNAHPSQVKLALDKAAYKAGDIAHVKVTPPAAGETLIMVESNDLLWSTRIHTEAGDNWVDIPVSEQWNRHDLYISALHLQTADNPERITPARAIGLIALPLDRSDRQLDISLDAPAKWLPDQTVETTIRVNDHNGQPVTEAWLTLAAVDEGVLSLTRFKTPDPHPFFFEQRAYNMNMFDLYGDLIELNNNRVAGLRWGGDASLERAGDLARAEVRIVALFSGRVAVKNGIARVPLQLPDFNGQLRLMVLAFDDRRYGHAEQNVIVAAPLVAELSMPRFVATGDQSTVALDITNLSGAEARLQVNISASGPATLTTQTSQSTELTLAHKQRQTLMIPFEATSPAGAIHFQVTVDGLADYPVKRQWTLNSRSAFPAETRLLQPSLANGEVLTLSADELSGWMPESLRAGLGISSNVNLNTEQQLQALLVYPYGCLEQTLSSAYPWVFASNEQLQALKLPTINPDKRQQALAKGMEGINKRQRSNGGFNLWSATDGDEEHWLSAHTANFLTDAMEAGIDVNQDVLKKSLKRLREYTRQGGNFEERWSSEPTLYRFTYQAYAHFVLARHKTASLADIRNLADRIPEKAPPLAILQLALAAKLQGDQALADTLVKRSSRDERVPVYIGDYGSPLRDTAMRSYLLWHYDMDQPQAADLLKKLSVLVKQRHYLSTQERLGLMLAALEMEKHGGESWQADLTVNAQNESLSASTPVYRLLSGNELARGLTLTNSSDVRLYTNLEYQGIPKEAPAPYSHKGVEVQRYYYDIKGKPLDVGNGTLTLNTGDLVLVELMVRSDDFRPDLLLIDLLPAGLELENQNLGDSIKLDEVQINQHSLEYWDRFEGYRHREYRDDRFIAAIAAGSDYWEGYDTTRVFYLARAVTPGEYQVPAPELEDMYDPEARGVGATLTRLVVKALTAKP